MGKHKQIPAINYRELKHVFFGARTQRVLLSIGLTASLLYVVVVSALTAELKPLMVNVNENGDFGCGSNSVVTKDIPGKEKKHIYLAENLIKATPHLGCRLWHTYETVATIALDIYAAGSPKYQPVIHFFNEQAPDDCDPLRPAEIVGVAADSPALATVGFAWATMAGIAAQGASKQQVPYISPTGAIGLVKEGSHSISLGLTFSDVARGFEYLMTELKEPNVVIVENTREVYEREFAQTIRESRSGGVHTIEYYGDSFPLAQVINFLNEHTQTRNLVLVPGPATLRNHVETILAEVPATAVLVGPHWTYGHRGLNFAGGVYCISDYYSTLDNEMHRLVTQKWHEHGGGEIVGGYLYALFDAVFFTIKALEGVNTRAEVQAQIKGFGIFRGSNGSIRINDGRITKQIYVTKYEYKNGFKLLKEIKS